MEHPEIERTGLRRRLLAGLGLALLVAPVVPAGLLLLLGLLGMVDAEATWHRFLHDDPPALGFEIGWDRPGPGRLTVRNGAASTARDVRVRIVEDYDYARGGEHESGLWLGDLESGESRTVPYGLSPAAGEIDIGALRVWITSDRGTAFGYAAWSYAF